MIYPSNFEQKIGFDIIRQMLRKNCVSPMGESYVEKIKFTSNDELLYKLLRQVDEFKSLLSMDRSFPSANYFDLTPELTRIKIEGTYIEQDKFFDLKSSLKSILSCKVYIEKQEPGKFLSLKALTENLNIDSNIIPLIEKIIDDKGDIKDSASAELSEIRKKLRIKLSSIDRLVNSTLKKAKKSGWVNDDTEITIRSGRLVIPIHASHKRQIRGFIHDQSATGQTVYIEPEEIFDVNNEIRELEGEEKREIIHILKIFSNFIRPFINELLEAYKFLGLIDFIRAKAMFSIKINGILPVITNKPGFNWNNAIHPLLFLSHQKQNKSVVPLDIKLDTSNRILVISGPNAGGKSVCLKTIGLLQYMLQCGLLIPVKNTSESGIFGNLFIDIGDEQSLENDLSTYSSHLMNMKHFVLQANANTLFLIDEFGTGTEPQLGGAIAEAILEKLNDKKAFGVITTHYSNLKLLARDGNGIFNGAMLFDTNLMQPTYQLSTGKPGSSFAFEIAKKIGFPKTILKNAEKKTGKKQLDFDQQLQQLDIEKQQLDRKKEEFGVADSFLSEMIEKYDNLKNDLESKKKKIIADAQEEAFDLIQSSNKLIEHTIKEIRESQADKEKTQLLRKKIWAEKERIRKEIEDVKVKKGVEKENKPEAEKKTKSQKIKVEKLKTGDMVRIPEQDVVGEVLSMSGGDVVIGFNSITFKTQINKIEKISAKEYKKRSSKSKKPRYSGLMDDINDKMANFSLQVDVRGKRGEEALSLVQQYINDAILLNMSEVRILHGKGFGILRNMIHEYLSSVSEVKHFKDEHIERGGNGITIVIFK